MPHVLDYEVELVLDGRTFERPANYALARIVPPKGVEVDPTRRPFVVVDPRAGHGPGKEPELLAAVQEDGSNGGFPGEAARPSR